MTAANTDLLMEVGTPGTATTLSAPGYTIGNTSITVPSTANWPTATGTIFAIDRAEVVNNAEVRVEGTYCEFSGTVASGSSVTDLNLEFGTPQDYAAGSLTRVYIPVSSERENRIVQWGLTHADQDGTLKDNAVDNSAVLANGIITNAKLSTAAGELGGEWGTWSPTPTGFLSAPANGVYRYYKIGKECTLFIRQPTDGTSNSTAFSIPLPFPAATITNAEWQGSAQIRNNSATASAPGLLVIASGSTTCDVFINYAGSTFTSSGGKRVGSGQITYEIA